MATQHFPAPRTGRLAPFGTLLLVIAIAVGIAAGILALRALTSTTTAAAVPARVVGVSGDASRVTTTGARQIVPTVACEAMDVTARSIYCSPASGINATPPSVTWQACEAMDVAAYRRLCSPGDGGRWVPMSEPDSVVH